MSPKFSRPLTVEAQTRLRERIAREGIEAVTKALGVSDYHVARGAAGARVAKAAAVAMETQLSAKERAA